ncbi:MAG TPA: S24 family peptidase [Thermoanaerobaculia bacterium]|jgi:phage repressor protein C with HTH and peptisase S24 domain
MDVVDRLIAAIDASGMKHTRIWPDAGMTKSKFSKIYNRKQVPTAVEYFNILRAIGRDPSRILTEGELVIDMERLRAALQAALEVREASTRLTGLLEELLPKAVDAAPASDLVKLPKTHSAAPVRAAADPNAELVVELESVRKRIPRRAWSSGARIIARVVGDSMDGGSDPLRDGELAYLKPTRSARTANNRTALVRRDTALFLKRFEISGRTIRLVSANPESPTIVIQAGEAENLQIYGIVVAHGAGI